MPKKPPKTARGDIRAAEQKLFEGNLTYSIMVLANLIGRNTSNHTLADFPVTVNEWRILRVASIFGPVCATDIISTLAIDKTTVSRAITSLHKGGYVDLAPNPDDRRQTLIVLTNKGWKLHGKIAPVDESIDKSFEDVLTATEINYFHRIMRKLRPFAQQLSDSTD